MRDDPDAPPVLVALPPVTVTGVAEVRRRVPEAAAEVGLSPERVASFTVAVACVVWPTESVDAANVTETLPAGAASTFTDAVPFLPWTWVVMIAVPFATPVTSPSFETVATAASDDDHLLLPLPETRPLASRALAVNCCC